MARMAQQLKANTVAFGEVLRRDEHVGMGEARRGACLVNLM